MKLKILLNPSNQLHNVDNEGVPESTNGRELAILVKNAISKSVYSDGVTVIVTPLDPADNLEKVVTFEHQCNPHLFVSFHFNGLRPNKASGTEVWYYGTDLNGRELAAKTSADIAKVLNIPDRGAKPSKNAPGGGIRVIDGTNSTAILIETCFQDSDSDMAKYRQNKHMVANAIARRIIDYLIHHNNLQKNVNVEPPKISKTEILNKINSIEIELSELKNIINKF
jgi:N-acetylmuramoyl-L-alanine amidase